MSTMKYNYSFLVFIIALVIQSCATDSINSEEEGIANSDAQNLILTLGASRVQGNRPEHESYRYELWKDLIANNFVVDFVGTQTDNASYPDFNALSFDTDHEGRSGFTSAQIANGITGWIDTENLPNVVLFSTPGGNDVLQGIPVNQIMTNINAIVDALQEANPNVTIIIEQAAPPKSELRTVGFNILYTLLLQEISDIASSKSTQNSKIITVDMFTGFDDSLLADDIHYNQAGAEFIAERYFDVLEDVLLK